MLFQFAVVIVFSCIVFSKVTNDLDEMYSKMFGLPTNGAKIDQNEQVLNFYNFDQSYKLAIEYALFENEIIKMFISTKNLSPTNQKKEIIATNSKKFDEFIANDNQQPTMIRNCEIWKLWRNFGDTFAKNNLLNTETQNFVQTRKKVLDLNKMNCSKIEKVLKQIDEDKANMQNSWVQIYLDDLKLRHFNALSFLVIQKHNGNAEKWKFSKYFVAEVLENETNFAFQLRVLHINNEFEKIRRVKYGIKWLTNEQLSSVLELYAPTVLAYEIIEDQLPKNYVQIFSNDRASSEFSLVAMSIRIYFGRIWQLFSNLKKRENDENRSSELWKILDAKFGQFFAKFYETNSLLLCHKLWFKLANIYNTKFAHNEAEKIRIKNKNWEKMVDIHNEIVEDHCKNMELLSSTQNLFSEHIKKNSNDEAKFRVKQFIMSMSKFNSANLEKKLMDFNELMKKFPALEQMLHFDAEEAYTIMDEYQKLLMRDEPIPKLELESFNINSIYFGFKQLFNEFVGGVQQMDNSPQQLLKQIVAQFVDDNFGKELQSEETKRVKICYMRSFSAWLMINYGLVINASDKMLQFIMEPEDNIKDSIGRKQSAKTANIWNKPNCEDEQVSKKVLQKLTKCPLIEQFHINQIIKFAAKYPHFLNFLNNAYDFGTFNTYEIPNVSMQKSLYERIFWSDNGVKQMSNEVTLALSHAISWIISRKNTNKNWGLQKAEKDLLIMLRLIDIFDDELPTFRMLCIAMPFIIMMLKAEVEKQKRLTWQAPDRCLSAEAEPVFAEQRKFMLPFHQIFFEEFLADFPHEELLMQIIRETPGKLHMLEQFIGKDELYKHFASAQIREKMIDRKLFKNNNKNKRLLDHYVRALCGQTSLERLTNRVSADLLVLMIDYFDVDKMGDEKAIKTLMDWWWLYIRAVYESLNENPNESIKNSYLINILIPEMDKFLANNKKFASKPKKFANAWTAIEKKANAEMEMQWFNSKNKPADPIELVQKMHFDQLNKMNNQKEGIEKEFEKLIRELQNNKNVRLNLLQLLTIEESNIFLDTVEYNKNEKENGENKNNGKRNKNKRKNNKKKRDEQLAESSSSKIMISDENKSDQNSGRNSDEIKIGLNYDENSNDQNEVVNNSDQNSVVIKSDRNSEVIKNDWNSDVISDWNSDVIKSGQNLGVNNSDQNSVVYKNDKINALSFDDQNNTNKIASKNTTNDEQKANELISNEFIEQKELTTKTILKNNDQNANEIAPTSIIKAEQNVEKITSMTNIFDFTDFCNDSTIFEMYKKYILFYFDEKKMEILDIGALINEIEQRIKMISDMGKLEYLNDYLNKNGAQNLIATWARMKSDLSTTKLENGQKMRFIEDNLYIIFRNISLFLDENAPLFVKMNPNEKQNLKMQIHLKNILLAFIEAKELGQIPPTLMLEDLGGKLFNLLQIRMGNFSIKKRFEEFKKMMEQIGIDQDLFEKKILKTEQENYLLPRFPLISQQLFVANSFDVITKSDQYFQNYLTTFLFGDFYKAQKFERKINDGIGTIASIVDKWSNKEARLLASGSLLLYSHTNSSDVNLVCLTPGERLKINDFMGNDKNAKCIINKCTEQTNAAAASSLFCQICAHKSTTNLIKIVSESILLIRFNFDGIEFDISLVAVPSISYLAQQINDNELANLLKRFDWSSNSDQKHMIRSLSSYRSTLYIYNLFNNPMANTDQRSFRHLLLAVRSWAKNNYIYSNKMGFLNGMSLAIMVTKIVLLYPNATLPFLFEKFFLFYSARLVKIPLQLTKIAKDDQDLLSNSSMFSFLKFNEFEMPLITPKFPVQNVARLVTHSNAKVIRLEMIKALRKIKSMKNRAFDLGELMEFIPFTQKYANFIVINCMAEQMDLAYDFCGFVEWRMRLQIIFSIDTKGGSFETHLYPNVYKENCNLPNNFVETSFRANYCKIWILGITNNSISNNSMSENLSSMAQQFDLAIKRDYLNKNKGTAPNHWLTIDDFYKTMKMELKSIVTKSEMIRGF